MFYNKKTEQSVTQILWANNTHTKKTDGLQQKRKKRLYSIVLLYSTVSGSYCLNLCIYIHVYDKENLSENFGLILIGQIIFHIFFSFPYLQEGEFRALPHFTKISRV